MEQLTAIFSETQIFEWEESIGNWFFWFSLVFLLFELIRLRIKGKLKWNVITDSVTNFITLAMYLGIVFLISAFYFGAYYVVYEYFSFTQIPITIWSIALCVVLADFAYYWEHRFTHRVGIAWATHTVHHSSPHFNISVAYRFGPLDAVFPLPFHLPLAVLGFNPFVILFSEMMVQLYQTVLHTEAIGKLPKPIEAIMNTPSHHRVHHGSNRQYIDKNYAGIFIIWDKLFGTFEEEKEKVIYGTDQPVNSVNPILVFFHGYTRLFKKVFTRKGVRNKLGYLVKPPGWEAG